MGRWGWLRDEPPGHDEFTAFALEFELPESLCLFAGAGMGALGAALALVLAQVIEARRAGGVERGCGGDAERADGDVFGPENQGDYRDSEEHTDVVSE